MTSLFQNDFQIDLQIDPLWCAWFSGFVAGEGCFSIDASLRKGSIDISVRLRVTLRDDDDAILLQIKDTLKCGSVKYLPAVSTTNPGASWRTNSTSEAVYVLIPLFDAYPLRNKKQNDYLIWREAAYLAYKSRGTNFDKIRDLKDMLVKQRTYSPSE